MKINVVVRFFSVTMIAMVIMATGATAVDAHSDQVLVGANGIDGIQLDTWASGAIDPVAECDGLRLSRLHFDPCTGITLHSEAGPVLIYSETSGVIFAVQGGESTPSTTLGQGDALVVNAGDTLTIVNDNIDPAFSSDLLLVSVIRGDSFVDVPMISHMDFPLSFQCDKIDPDGGVTPTVLAEGAASEGGDTLYVGSAYFAPGSTTEGWGLSNEGSAFNLAILGGGMNTAGPNSGRAAFVGPGGVIEDYYLESNAQIDSYPFKNESDAPVFGLVFGTVEGSSVVWMPV